MTLASDRLAQPRDDDATPAASSDQAKRTDQPDRTPAAKTADQPAPRAEARSRQQYLAEIRAQPMVRHDNASQDGQAHRRGNDRPATPPQDRNGHQRDRSDRAGHSRQEKSHDHPRSGEDQARHRDPDRHVQDGTAGRQQDNRREPDAQQRAIGEELAKDYEQKIDQQINRTADAVNPSYDRTKSAYSENCTGVVQAYELRRRGHDVQAGPLENHLRKDEGGPGGRSLSAIEQTWGGKFTPGSKADIEDAFKQPGSRGVVYIRWHVGGAHVFNVENNSGRVRFVDGQPTPARYDASNYFGKGHDTRYLRTDDRPDPPEKAAKRYLES